MRSLKLLFLFLLSCQTTVLSAATIMSYWTNWSIYSNDPTTRAIPEPAYGMPGSYDAAGAIVNNPDMSEKVNYLDSLTYAFFEVQPNGMIYFSDPNADLRLSDPADKYNTDEFCSAAATSAICNYKQKAATWGRGNFNLGFVNLQNIRGLHKIISIGGYGHDASMEYAFASSENTSNFVNSIAALKGNYPISGVGLDYEPPSITSEQAAKYTNLIQTLRNKLEPETVINITILANPDWINTFGQNNWKIISLAVNNINVMTYDFHGAFDYPESTGFLANLYIDPNDTHTNKFSVDTAITALINNGVPSNKIIVGIPAYGRALEGASNVNYGLYQPFSKIPKGDLDPKDCSQVLPLAANGCAGSYQYKYIIGNMINPGVAFTDHSVLTQGVTSGVWAYDSNIWIDTVGNQLSQTFISYDNVVSVKAKAEYVKNKNLAGIMIWELRGDIAPSDPSKASLLAAIADVLGIQPKEHVKEEHTYTKKDEL